MTPHINIHTSLDSLDALTPEWLALCSRSKVFAAFSGPGWFQAAIECFQQTPFLVTLHNNGLQAVLPMLASTTPTGRHFEFPFALSGEWLDLVVASDDPESGPLLLGYFFEHLQPGDTVMWSNLSKESALIRSYILAHEAHPEVLHELKIRHPAPFIDLSSGYTAYLSSKSKNFRKDLKRNELDFNAFAWKALPLSEVRDQANAVVDFFLESFHLRFGPRSIYASEAATAFCRTAFPPLIKAGLLTGEVQVDSSGGFQTLSLEAERGTERLAFQDAYRIELREHGVSRNLYIRGLQRAFDSGRTVYDLSRISNELKERFKTGERYSYALSLMRE